MAGDICDKVLRVGPYHLSKTLGLGTYATVRLGVHQTTQQKVAIKMISKSAVKDHPSLIPRTQREVVLLKMVAEHPNVVQLVDYLETDWHMLIVLEYIEGGDLFAYLDRHVCRCERNQHPVVGLPVKEAFPLFYQLVGALEHCHNLDIAHRDIKPENVLMDASHKFVKLTDFGTANLTHQDRPQTRWSSVTDKSQQALMSTVCGTPQYCAPEVLRREKYNGKAADIWSLGVLLYVMCSARLPFSESEIRSLVQQVNGEAMFTIPDYFDPNLRDLVEKMVRMDPSKRLKISEVKTHRWWLAQCLALGLDPVDPSSFGNRLSPRLSSPQVAGGSTGILSPSAIQFVDQSTSSIHSNSSNPSLLIPSATRASPTFCPGSPTSCKPLLLQPILPNLILSGPADSSSAHPSPTAKSRFEVELRASLESNGMSSVSSKSTKASMENVRSGLKKGNFDTKQKCGWIKRAFHRMLICCSPSLD